MMNPIIKLLKDHNVSESKIAELFKGLTENPLAAMSIIQDLGIPSEQLQSLMMIVMTTPALIEQAVAELGLDLSQVEEAKAKLKSAEI